VARRSVIVFEPYPFQEGQKINIKEGPRRGDWEVIGVSNRKVKLRCPISLREVEWDTFCYCVKEGVDMEWPNRE
jgi:hypothetical protein